MKVKNIPKEAFDNVNTIEQALDLTIQKWYNLSHCNITKIEQYNSECALCCYYRYRTCCGGCILAKAYQDSGCYTEPNVFLAWDNSMNNRDYVKAQAYAFQLYKTLLKIRTNLKRRKKRKYAKTNEKRISLLYTRKT